MKKIGTTVFALLTVTALTRAPATPTRQPTPEPTVAEATGDGIFGAMACYSCLGAAFASSTLISPLTPAIWGTCESLCTRVL